jgi:hypothetical protein
MIRFACPHCRKRLKADPGRAMQSIRCPACGKPATVPLMSDDAVSAPPPPHPPIMPVAHDDRTAALPPDTARYRELFEPEPSPPQRPVVLTAVETPAFRPQAGQFRCPFCQTTAMPLMRSQISTGGYIVMVVMILFCFPFFFIGLLMKEDYRSCSLCGIKLG